MAGVRMVISGGQTGADRGALNAAIELGIPHGGACPKGRRAEDGRIPEYYRLTELGTSNYPARTRRNLQDADGTLLVTRGVPTGGSKLTQDAARVAGTHFLHIDLDRLGVQQAAGEVNSWLEICEISVLNVAGPRASGCPGIASDVSALLLRVLSRRLL